MGKHSCPTPRTSVLAPAADEVSDDEDTAVNISVPQADLKTGKYDIIFCHPEALFGSAVGQSLLADEDFQAVIMATVIDECHKVEHW